MLSSALADVWVAGKPRAGAAGAGAALALGQFRAAGDGARRRVGAPRLNPYVTPPPRRASQRLVNFAPLSGQDKGRPWSKEAAEVPQLLPGLVLMGLCSGSHEEAPAREMGAQALRRGRCRPGPLGEHEGVGHAREWGKPHPMTHRPGASSQTANRGSRGFTLRLWQSRGIAVHVIAPPNPCSHPLFSMEAYNHGFSY